jgi:uncharacterized integral membrane protein
VSQQPKSGSLRVLFVSLEAPLIVILAVFLLVGALIGYAAPVLLRHRRTERAKVRAIEPGRSND